MKIVTYLIGLAVGTASLNAAEVGFTGGVDENGTGAVYNSDLSASNTGNAVGFFVINNSSYFEQVDATFTSDYFNDAIAGDHIEIVGGTSITDVLPFDGAFTGGFDVSEDYGGMQIYVFATNSSFANTNDFSSIDWSFSEIGIWTNPEWLIPSGVTGLSDAFDLGNLDPSETIWGGALEIGDTGTYQAIMAPAIPEPSTYALMMMGVALGYTIYRRRKKA